MFQASRIGCGDIQPPLRCAPPRAGAGQQGVSELWEAMGLSGHGSGSTEPFEHSWERAGVLAMQKVEGSSPFIRIAFNPSASSGANLVPRDGSNKESSLPRPTLSVHHCAVSDLPRAAGPDDADPSGRGCRGSREGAVSRDEPETAANNVYRPEKPSGGEIFRAALSRSARPAGRRSPPSRFGSRWGRDVGECLCWPERLSVVEDAQAGGLGNCFASRVRVELAKDCRDMVVDRASRDDEAVGDFGVPQTFREEGEDVQLAGCEICGVLARGRSRAAWHGCTPLPQSLRVSIVPLGEHRGPRRRRAPRGAPPRRRSPQAHAWPRTDSPERPRTRRLRPCRRRSGERTARRSSRVGFRVRLLSIASRRARPRTKGVASRPRACTCRVLPRASVEDRVPARRPQLSPRQRARAVGARRSARPSRTHDRVVPRLRGRHAWLGPAPAPSMQ